MKVGDMSSLIESENGTSDLCSAPSKGQSNREREWELNGHQLLVHRELSHNQTPSFL